MELQPLHCICPYLVRWWPWTLHLKFPQTWTSPLISCFSWQNVILAPSGRSYGSQSALLPIFYLVISLILKAKVFQNIWHCWSNLNYNFMDNVCSWTCGLECTFFSHICPYLDLTCDLQIPRSNQVINISFCFTFEILLRMQLLVPKISCWQNLHWHKDQWVDGWTTWNPKVSSPQMGGGIKMEIHQPWISIRLSLSVKNFKFSYWPSITEMKIHIMLKVGPFQVFNFRPN